MQTSLRSLSPDPAAWDRTWRRLLVPTKETRSESSLAADSDRAGETVTQNATAHGERNTHGRAHHA
jgi:hypothetical protein